MKKIIWTFVLGSFVIAASFVSPAHAQTDQEYEQKVKQNVRIGAFASSVAWGKASATVKVVDKQGQKVAVLSRPNTNPDFNAEVLRAANKVIDNSVSEGLKFNVVYGEDLFGGRNR